MLTRNLGKLLHGKVSTFQILAACTLGVMLGMQPSWANAPALVALLVSLLFILNANLFLAGLAILLGKLLIAVGLLPPAFTVGRWLIDGPLQPVFREVINAPVLALMGFEYYATTGALVLGALVGVTAGLLLLRVVRGVQKKLATMETDSQRYATLSRKKWFKAVTWLVFGGRGRKTYAELAATSKLGNPFRPLGMAAVTLLAVLCGLVYVFLADEIVTAVAVRGLERVNGATVDLDGAQVSLREGRVTFTGLAMADPNALDTDLFRAGRLEADLSAADLLRKRFAIDNLRITDASTGSKRATRGHLVGKRLEPVEPPPTPAEQKTLEDYVAQAQQWKDRLAQVRKWLESTSAPESPESPDATPAPDEQTFDDWVKAQVALLGYADVKADHLIEGAPTFLIRQLVAEGVVAEQLDGEKLDITATNLSTHPALVGEPPRIKVVSATGDRLRFDLALPVSAAGRDTGLLDFALKGLPVDKIADGLRIDGGQPVQGGTYDIALSGDFSPASLHLPLQLVLHDTTLTIPGSSPQPVSQLPLTLGLRGALDSPRFVVDQKQLTDALVAAGANELANRARGEVDKAVDEAKGELREEIDKAVGDEVGGALKGIFGDKKKEEAPKE